MHAIGVDIGGSNLRAALVDIETTANVDSWRMLQQARIGLSRGITPGAVVQKLADLVAAFPVGLTEVAFGVGIAAMLKGHDGVIENAPNLGWRDVDFGALLQRQFGRPVGLENDLTAISWGEFRFGAGKQSDNMLCVFVGTGVGGGVVTEGRPYRGANNAAMEIGHLLSQPNGKLCGCGASGCLEAYVGGRHLAEVARGLSGPQIAEICPNPDQRHAGHLELAALAGDSQAVEALDGAAYALGRGLASAVTLFNPDSLVLGGTVWEGVQWLRRGALRALDQLTNAPARRGLTILAPQLGDRAGVLGAADLALQNLSLRNLPQR